MEHNKKKILKNSLTLLLVALFFLVIGAFLFFIGPWKRLNMDSQVEAYDVVIDSKYKKVKYKNEYGSYYDYEIRYSPIYYYMVDGVSYEHRAEVWAKSDWNIGNKRMIYYSSENPKKCISEYEVNKFLIPSIILFAVGFLIIIFDIILFARTVLLGKYDLESSELEKPINPADF